MIQYKKIRPTKQISKSKTKCIIYRILLEILFEKSDASEHKTTTEQFYKSETKYILYNIFFSE